MQIPAYARPTLEAYQASGTIKGHRSELDHQSAEACLQSYKDEFSRWQSLDESEADLFKGRPGEVRIASSAGSGYTEASFSGDVHSGRLAVAQNDPQTHYGFSSYAHTCFKPQSVENLSLQSSRDLLLGPELVHIERQLSSDGPVVLGGGPVSVTLSDHAGPGYVIHQGAGIANK